jgi:hypothetical protein
VKNSRRNRAVVIATNLQDIKTVVNPTMVVSSEEVTDHQKLVEICGKILSGKPGTPPIIFGLDLDVQEWGDHYTVILFKKAVEGSPLFGLLRENVNNPVFVPLSMLRSNLKKITSFHDSDQEALFVYLATQTAMVDAKRIHWEKQQAATLAAAEEDMKQKEASKKDLIASLRNSAAQKPQPEKSATQEFGKALLSAESGEFLHESGVVLLLQKGKYDSMVISVVACPTGHVMEDVMKAKAFAHRHHIVNYPQERDANPGGIIGKAQDLRVWLRKELRAIGALPPLEDSNVVSMAGVDQEHEAALVA